MSGFIFLYIFMKMAWESIFWFFSKDIEHYPRLQKSIAIGKQLDERGNNSHPCNADVFGLP